MHHGEVISLHEILDQAFPVGVPVFFEGCDMAHPIGFIIAQQRFELFQTRRQRGCIVVEIDIDEAVPELAAEFRQ